MVVQTSPDKRGIGRCFSDSHSEKSKKKSDGEQGQEISAIVFHVECKVIEGDTLNPRRRVATGVVMSLGGNGMFHNRPITAHCVRVTLETVLEKVLLMVSVEDADQATLHDAVGSNILWFGGLTFPE